MSHGLAGARGRIEDHESVLKRAADWASARGCEVLLADARFVFGRDHMESAILHARRAQASGTMTAHFLPMETLLFLAGQRQVTDAIRLAGLREGTDEVAVVLFEEGPMDELIAYMGWDRDDRVLEPAGKSPALLGVTPTEEKTVPEPREIDLVLEKVALVDVLK